MKSAAAVRTPHRVALKGAPDDSWRERAGALFAEFERPALAMLRRAFRGAFSPDELDDIYSSAWVGTLRALADRHTGLADDEIRSYVLTAVANQAGKELRRRKRKPTAPLEPDAPVADSGRGPEEVATDAEQSQVTRDLLASLPRRRRAVILLRYGWGLEPAQVCELVKGLSPRAYRKEITRGVDELAEKMRAFERGDWCADREPVLKAFAAGLADDDQIRQAKAHMAHCRDCSEFVARLTGHLHDLGGAVVAPIALEDLDDRIGIGERIADGVDRAREAAGGLFGRGTTGPVEDVAVQVGSSGGARGAGVAGAGVIAKLAAVGTAGKVAVACVGGGVAATACIAAGVVPGVQGEREPKVQTADQRTGDATPNDGVAASPAPLDLDELEPDPTVTDPESAQPPAAPQPDGQAQDEPTDPEPAPAPAPTSPVAPETSPVQQEFGAPAAAAPAPAPTSSSTSSTGGGSGGGTGSVVRQEFGP